MMHTLRTLSGRTIAILRIAGLLTAITWHLSLLLGHTALRGRNEQRGFRYRRRFTRDALRILGVRMSFIGEVPDGPALYVSNHRSLLDPLIQLSVLDAYIVSKAEVSRYPLFGRGARETGVVFVQRTDLSSRNATRENISRLLREGKSVLLYPEGTTGAQPGTMDFRRGSFVIAAGLQVPVVPVVIDYCNTEHYWSAQPMMSFFLRKFSGRRIDATLMIGTPVVSDDADRLLSMCRSWIDEGIQMVRDKRNSHNHNA